MEMDILKYTTLDDITAFLKTLDYYWTGKINAGGRERQATIEDFAYGVTLRVHDGFPNPYNCKSLTVYVSDLYFHIAKEQPKKKYDVYDHSLRWKTLMMRRKEKEYAKLVYAKAMQDEKNSNNMHTEMLNLLQQKTEKINKDRQLEHSINNTLILNAKQRLTEEDTMAIDAEINQNNI